MIYYIYQKFIIKRKDKNFLEFHVTEIVKVELFN